jgi:hypothetical protein
MDQQLIVMYLSLKGLNLGTSKAGSGFAGDGLIEGM